MSFTADEYRTAAKVIRDVGMSASSPDLLEEKAEKVEVRETYALSLIGSLIPNATALYNGALLMDRLIRDGWTPPEGLF